MVAAYEEAPEPTRTVIEFLVTPTPTLTPEPTATPQPTRTPTTVPPTATPTPAPVQAAEIQAPPPRAFKLSEEEMLTILVAAGWPSELHRQALDVAFCESRYGPGSINYDGPWYGIFQLSEMWFAYAGESFASWADPLVNARTALAVYYHDINKGLGPWKQWGCKPKQ